MAVKMKNLLLVIITLLISACNIFAVLDDHESDKEQPHASKTPFEDGFWAERAEAIRNYPVPEAADSSRYTGGIIYIDPSATENGNGSMDNPLNGWPDTLAADTAYLQKRGTAWNSSWKEQFNDNFLIGAYGDGERPNLGMDIDDNLILYGDTLVIRDVQVFGIQFGKYPCVLTDKHWVYNCETSIVGIFASLTWTKIIGNDIHDNDAELIWVYGAHLDSHAVENQGSGVGNNIEVAWNHLYNANMAWSEGATQLEAPGDAIHYASANGTTHIHHNIIDRSSTGNKFNIILGEPDSPEFNAIIEDNIFYPPKKTNQGGAVLYLKSILGSCIIRNNIFYNEEEEGMANVWSEDGDFEFYGNLVKGFGSEVNTGANSYYNNTVIDCDSINASQSDHYANNLFSTNYNNSLDGSTNLFIDQEGAETLFMDEVSYRILKNGPARGTGIDWDNHNYWPRDFYGTTSSPDGSFDIGSFRYSSVQ